jgi:hypothetical protein
MPDRVCHSCRRREHAASLTLPSIGQKKITAAFDGGRIGSDGGILLLAGADRCLGLIDTLARNAVQPAGQSHFARQNSANSVRR